MIRAPAGQWTKVSTGETEHILLLSALGKADLLLAGGKGANLGELLRVGLPVPPGFVVTAPAFLAAMDQGGVRQTLEASRRRLFETKGVDHEPST